MTIRNLDYLLQPASVALLGVDEPSAAVQALTRNLCESGYAGDIFLVGRARGPLRGKAVYRKLSELPQPPDLAVLAPTVDVTPRLIAALGEAGVKAAALIAPPPEHNWPARRQALLTAARPRLLRLLGPDCHALLTPGIGLNIGFSPTAAAAGRLAFFAQSSAVVMAVLDWAQAHGVGFSRLIALGDEIDVDCADVLDYLTDDPGADAMLFYLETIPQARKFMSAARAAARTKPVLVLKAGDRQDALYDAAFRRAGMLRVGELRDLFGAVETLALAQPVYGDRLAILSNGGGVGIMARDLARAAGARLARLSPNTRKRFNQALPRRGSKDNPIDILDDAPGERYAAALTALLRDPGVDAVLVVHAPTALVSVEATAQAVIETLTDPAVSSVRKPCAFVCWLGGRSAEAARRLFAARGIPSYDTPGDAVRALMDRVLYRRNQELLMETPPAIAADFTPDLAAARAALAGALAEGRAQLSDLEALQLLAAYGIATPPTWGAATPEEAAGVAADYGEPVALKIQAANIRHKLDVDGVALELETPAVTQANAVRMLKRIQERYPAVRPSGFIVQGMARRPQAHELRLHVQDDPLFGPVIVFGHGGLAADVIDDNAYALPPLNLQLAKEAMARTRIYSLLQGRRGTPAAELDAIALTLVRISQLTVDLAEVTELEIDPLLADADGVLALGARATIASGRAPAAQRLAIRPYPQELEETIVLPDGRRFLLRPVRPEDEPEFRTAFARLSPREIRMRFLHPMTGLTHALAARLTQIDYDREMALVLVDPAGADGGAIYGVVRLVMDPDRERAEFAIIIGAIITGMGLGSLLLRRMIDYARRQGVKEIYGDVLRDNQPMLKLCQALGFALTPDPEDAALVRVVLAL